MEIVECGTTLTEINSRAEPDKDAAIRLFLLITNPWAYAAARIASVESISHQANASRGPPQAGHKVKTAQAEAYAT
jgi:hypothetical protein